MLAVSSHDKIKKIINKKGYLISEKKLSNYDKYKGNIDSLLNSNYEIISNDIDKLSDKAILFLKNPKVLEHLRVNDITSYSITKINANYIIDKMFNGFKYEIIGEKIDLNRHFNSPSQAEDYINTITNKKNSIKLLFNQFNLKYILVFNISHSGGHAKQIIIDTSYSDYIGLYAVNECINEELLDFDNDTLIVGIKATNNWQLKRTAISESKNFILSNAYPNFTDIKTKLCDPKGEFLDDVGETLIEIGFVISETDDIPLEKNTDVIEEKPIMLETVSNKHKLSEEDTYNKAIDELNKAFNLYMSYKLSPIVNIDENFKPNINKYTIEEKRKIELDIKNCLNKFMETLNNAENPLLFKLDIINNKIDELYNEMVPF